MRAPGVLIGSSGILTAVSIKRVSTDLIYILHLLIDKVWWLLLTDVLCFVVVVGMGESA